MEPVPIGNQLGFMGLGKWTYEVDKAADATETRRKLDVEVEETEEMRQKKLVCETSWMWSWIEASV